MPRSSNALSKDMHGESTTADTSTGLSTAGAPKRSLVVGACDAGSPGDAAGLQAVSSIASAATTSALQRIEAFTRDRILAGVGRQLGCHGVDQLVETVNTGLHGQE